MSAPIPIDRAWLAIWPVEGGAFRCLAHDGPLPAERMAKLRAIGGFERPCTPGESLSDLFATFDASPGWADPVQAMAEFARIDRDPMLRLQMQADMERRREITRECKTFAEVVQALVKAGEMESSTAKAIGVAA